MENYKINYDCPTCGTTHKFSSANIGKMARCKSCQCVMKIEPEIHMRAEVERPPVFKPIIHSGCVTGYRAEAPLTRRDLETLSKRSSPPSASNVLCAIINLLFCPFGYLVQGRVVEFFAFICGALGLFVLGVMLVFPLFALPLLWIYSVYDSATYEG